MYCRVKVVKRVICALGPFRLGAREGELEVFESIGYTVVLPQSV